MNFFEIRDWFADKLCDFLREKDEKALQKLNAVVKAILYGKVELPEKEKEELLSEFPLLKWNGGFLSFDVSSLDSFTEFYLKAKARRYENFLATLGDFEPVGDDVEKNVLMARELFRAGLFFEVHELLEHVWMGDFSNTRNFLQALIQVGSAFYHLENYNERGYRLLLENALHLLESYSGKVFGIDVLELRSKIKLALQGDLEGENLL
ncbi:MAG: hypothetical protein DSY35_03440 [Desulfurobacterium sp.]|nr:MAG: hypothetical protein DSY35_03440 [Desulfurobacterium sp.]